jgi:hypothetical protein
MFARRRDPADIFRRVYAKELFALFQERNMIPVAITPETECGAVIQSAGTVLRAVMLFKGLESFVRMSVLTAMGRAVDGLFKGWQAYQCVRFRREELLEAFVVHVHVAIEHMAFKWMVDRLVTRWARTLMLIKATGKLERFNVNLLIRGATRQWCEKNIKRRQRRKLLVAIFHLETRQLTSMEVWLIVLERGRSAVHQWKSSVAVYAEKWAKLLKLDWSTNRAEAVAGAEMEECRCYMDDRGCATVCKRCTVICIKTGGCHEIKGMKI